MSKPVLEEAPSVLAGLGGSGQERRGEEDFLPRPTAEEMRDILSLFCFLCPPTPFWPVSCLGVVVGRRSLVRVHTSLPLPPPP